MLGGTKMQDAKITQTEPNREQPQGIPSLITEDDLQLEIGRWVVSALNKDKMIRQLAIRQQKLVQQVAEGTVAIKKSVELDKSNKALSEQNLALDKELTKARTGATDADRKAAIAEGTLVSTRIELEKAVSMADEKRDEAQAMAVKATEAISVIQGELDLAQEEIKKLKSRKKKGKK